MQLLCQLALLALSVGASMDGGISEIDLIFPTPNATYAVPDYHFPFIWAIRNPYLWRGPDAFLRYSITDGLGPIDFNLKLPPTPNYNPSNTIDIMSTDNSTRYLGVASILLKDEGQQYNMTWTAYGAICNRNKSISFGTNPDVPVENIWNIQFQTKSGGQKANLSSIASVNCADRPALAYNIATAMDEDNCRYFDNDDPYPPPAPCDLDISEKDIINIMKAINDYYDARCKGDAYTELDDCPGYKTKGQKNAGTQFRLTVTGLIFWTVLEGFFLWY